MQVLQPFSFGVGDRFAHQASAQLKAFQLLREKGVEVVPVWNKSYREHTTIGSEPPSVQAAAAAAVEGANWDLPYYIDADHIRLETVDGFIATSDFYTIDVADSIGQPSSGEQVEQWVQSHPELVGNISISEIDQPFVTTAAEVQQIIGKYLAAVKKAGQIYRHIEGQKGSGNFVTEVSMDETDSPQTPVELLIILAALADEKIPLQTIAPKFTGRFNKGVDYVGDLVQFEKEFNDDLAVIAHAVRHYELPPGLKLSVHSGSDKFSLYAPIRRALARFGAGLHIKTAGTTWLEEVIGLAESGGAGLEMAKEIYAQALAKQEALCAPYAAVIDIDTAQLPTVEVVSGWTSEQYVAALRHEQSNPAFNPHMRQLIHVGYKIAAQMGDRYLDLLKENEEIVGRNVTDNIFERHMKPLFLDQ